MDYKISTILIFVVLMLLTIFLIFSDTTYGLLIIGAVVPLLVVAQVFAVLMAKDTSTKDYADGKYDNN